MIVTTPKRATSSTTLAQWAANWLRQQCGNDLEALAGSDPKALDAVCQFVATGRKVDKVIEQCDGSLIAIVALAVSVAQLAQSMRNVQALAKRAA